MDIAEVFLIASTLLILLDILVIVRPKSIALAQKISPGIIASVFILGSYCLLIFYFVTNNFGYENVLYYSSTSLTIIERIYATWASSEGSWLLMTSLFAITYMFLRLKSLIPTKNKNSILFLDFFLLAFLIILLAESPFSIAPESLPDGQGLNPLLLSPWMIIHPVVVFIGYVLTIQSFALTVDTLGETTHSTLSRVFAQLSWLFMTFGIVLGGIWAYIVLGWGGYWAWDPVETASLLPWLAITAYFHMSSSSFKGAVAQEFMLMVASTMVLFAGAITRGGFVSSVHAFGFSYAGFILIGLLVAQIIYFQYVTRKRGPIIDFNLNTTALYPFSLSISFISLIVILVICIWGLLIPTFQGLVFGMESSISADFFTKWVYAPTLIFALSLVGCQTSIKLSIKQFAIIVGLSVMAGITLVLMNTPTPNVLANFGLPSLIVSGVFTIIGIINFRRRSLTVPRNLVHLGVVLILIGTFVSTSMNSETGTKVISPGATLANSNVEVTFGNFTIVKPFGRVYYGGSFYPQAGGIEIPIHVNNNGIITDGVIKAYYYTLNGVIAEPYVATGIKDAYVTIYVSDQLNNALNNILHGGDTVPPHISVNLVVNPLVNMIWIGSIVMSLGLIAQMIIHPIKGAKQEPIASATVKKARK